MSSNSIPFPSFPGKSRSLETQTNPYLACMVDPEHFPMRYPDEFSTHTALYSSKMYIDIYGNFSALSPAADYGRFAYFIKPSLGIISGGPAASLYNSKVVASAPNSAWPSNTEFYQDPNIDNLLGTATTHDKALVRSIRPVAMSAWFRWTAPTLNMGGQVAMALMDGEPSDYVSQALYNYANLSILPDSYEGQIVNGSYGFWRSFDNDDCVFRSGNANWGTGYDFGATYKYPALVVSGQLAYQGSGPYAGVIGRLEIVTIHEYVTHSRVVASEPSPVRPQLIVEAKQLLQGVPSCMSNDGHEGFFGSLLNIAKKYVLPNLSKVGGVVGTALGGPALGSVLSGVGSGITTAGQMLQRRNEARRAAAVATEVNRLQRRENIDRPLKLPKSVRGRGSKTRKTTLLIKNK